MSTIHDRFVQHVVYYSLAFLDALPHLCLHVNLVNGDSDSREVLSALIGLMKDSDPAVRKCFSQSVRFLLMESERNSGLSFLSEVSQCVTLSVLKAIFLRNHLTFVLPTVTIHSFFT